MFEDSEPDRKRVMVVLKHLDDEPELDFSAGDMTRTYWTGSVDEPDVFVVAIGNNAKYTAQHDRLRRLAGSLSRLLYLDEWSVEEASAIIPIIRLGFKIITCINYIFLMKVSSLINPSRKRICGLVNMPPPKPAVKPQPAGHQCYDETAIQSAWEKTVCCAQADIFIGFQVTESQLGHSSLITQVTVYNEFSKWFEKYAS